VRGGDGANDVFGVEENARGGEAAWRLCPTRARVGENCKRRITSVDRFMAEQRRRASMARVAMILSAAVALS